MRQLTRLAELERVSLPNLMSVSGLVLRVRARPRPRPADRARSRAHRAEPALMLSLRVATRVSG